MEQRLIDVNAYLNKVCTYSKTGCGSCKLQTACPVNEPTIEAEPRWIPVSEKLPKYSDSVLVWTCDHEIDIGSYYSDMWHINGCGSVEDGTVLAWMPLPKPYCQAT